MRPNLFVIMGGLLLSGLLAANGLAQAPAEKKPESKPTPSAQRPPPRDAVGMLAQRLDLNEAQISKVKALYDDQDKKMREARTAAAGNPAELRDKLGKIREETRAKMKDILTPEQWEKFSTPRSSRPKPAPTDAAPAK